MNIAYARRKFTFRIDLLKKKKRRRICPVEQGTVLKTKKNNKEIENNEKLEPIV